MSTEDKCDVEKSSEAAGEESAGSSPPPPPPAPKPVKLCAMCSVQPFKYTCPGCSVLTCSLACCKQHKANTGCDGRRDKTKFVAKTELDEQTLINDYRFLEEQARLVDVHQRTPLDFITNPSLASHPQQQQQQEHGPYEHLRKFVYKQFNTQLHLMPAASTRRKTNKTRFNRTTNTVSWSLELVFDLSPTQQQQQETNTKAASSNNLFRYSTKSLLFSSKCTLREALVRFFGATSKKKLFELDTSVVGVVDEKQLVAFAKKFRQPFDEQQQEQQESKHIGTLMTDLHVLFEVVDERVSKRFFVEFELDDTIEKCLCNRSLIEFPTLFVVKTDDLVNYNLTSTRPTPTAKCDQHSSSSPSSIAPTTTTTSITPALASVATTLEKSLTSKRAADTNNVKEDGECEDGECDDDDDEDEVAAFYNDSTISNKKLRGGDLGIMF